MYKQMMRGRAKPSMLPYVLWGAIYFALVMQPAVASLFPAEVHALPPGSPVKARSRQNGYRGSWQREILESNQEPNSESRLLHECRTTDWRSGVDPLFRECRSRDGGQHSLPQLSGSDSFHGKGSFGIPRRSPQTSSIAAASYQSEARSRRLRVRYVRHVRASFRTTDGKAVIQNRQVAVLMSVKAAIVKDPMGVLGSWHPNASTACDWAGVLCSPHEEEEPVVALDLSGRQLVGDIRSILVALARLEFLQHLDLSVNGLHGSLWGPALGNMSSLQYLNFTSNRVTGSVPSEIGKLRNLEILSLSTNNLTGALPPSIGNCSNLTALELGENFLAGGIPDVFDNTPRLQRFDVGNPIPLIISSDFAPMSNSLSGSFPSSLGNCSFLLYLDVSGNPDLGGDIAPQISLLTELQFLGMSFCSFTGVLENWWGNMTNLRHLDVRNNQLEGKIPASLGKLSMLIELGLSKNSLSGTIPKTITNCTSLELLSLAFNSLTGRIDDLSFNKWSRTITFLLLGENLFTGVIPPSMANCSSLEFLSVSDNAFDPQSIPEWIGSLPSLRLLEFGNMNLQGKIPNEIGKLQNLEHFVVSQNSLRGAIPSVLSNCSFMTNLDVAVNQLSGTVPPELGQLSNLEYFAACFNSLTGPIPLSFGNLTSLSILQINSNSLSGKINSIAWGMMLHLGYSNLSDNNFMGTVPSFLCNYSELYYLDLSANHFTGQIPASLGNLTRVTVTSLYIDLSFNKLSGKIPGSIFKSSQLVALWVPNNDLEGPIPLEIGQSTNLLSLDLSWNRLDGELPESLRNCSNIWEIYLHANQLTGGLPMDLFREVVHLRYLDVSDNLFSGPWPQHLAFLQDIQFINLSTNNFSGSVTVRHSRSSAAWSLLESLDVSSNNFDGVIPATWGSLPVLHFLNLSYNNFHGPIPNISSFHGNLSNASFLGNPGLCGALLGPGRECAAHAPLSPASGARKTCKGLVCKRAWIATTAAGSGFLLLVATLALLCWWKARRSNRHRKIQNVPFDTGVPFQKIGDGEIRSMMSSEHIIGRGANSVVYKGVRPGGQVFAIKTLHFGNMSTDEDKDMSPNKPDQEQLLQEVHTLARVCHRNILKVLSLYFSDEIKAIILEYMPEGSLHNHLHPHGGAWCKLSFQARLAIAIGIADGMKYLHHDLPSPIIHGDLKPRNILLDQDFTAKVADFGLSKFVQQQHEGGERQHVSASTVHIRGTPGYIPPEYGFEGRVSTRGDVYSYGIQLLEILTGRPPIEGLVDKSVVLHTTQEAQEGARAGSIVETAADPSCNEGYRERILSLYEANSLEMLDAELLQESTSSPTKQEQMKFLLLVALLCTKKSPHIRPTMSDVSSILVQINEMGRDSLVAWRTIDELAKEPLPQEDA